MEHISISSNVIFHIAGWPITNSIIATWFAMFVIVLIAYFGTRKIHVIPKGMQNIVEFIVEALSNLIQSVTQDVKKTTMFLPWIATFFLFILLANWMELLPGFSAIIIKEGAENVPVLRSMNTDLNSTLALAIISVVMIQVFGITSLGFGAYVKKYLNFSGVIDFFVGFLEIISEFARILSFAFRLFGNIFAGEVLLLVITFLVPIIMPVPFYAMEIFVGFIQALVFSMLTIVFMSMATSKHA